jgi:hypothetical protein
VRAGTARRRGSATDAVVAAARERTERALCFRCNGKPLLAASGQFDLPHTDHAAIFGQTVFHRGDDLIGKRDLRIYPRSFLAAPLI